MFRPSKELLTEPGIRYLEYYGMRYIRAYSYLRIGMAVMSGIFFSVAMVTFSLHVMDDFIPFYYVMSGMGVIFFLLAIIFVLFFPDRRFFKNIVELRDKNAVTELKEILSKPGVKSTLAMLALIDLGEVEPETFYRMNRGRDQQSLDGV